MGKQQESKYYDEIYRESKTYRGRYLQSHYWPMWTFIVQLIESARGNKPLRITDLGCGTGQFAECVGDFIWNHRYIGIDFSDEAIKVASNRGIPDAIFIRGDIFTAETGDPDIVTILETLEHVNNDIGLLSKIKEGTIIIASVPSFDDAGHTRWFNSKEEVRQRYGKFFREMGIAQTFSWYVFWGQRSDATTAVTDNTKDPVQ